MSDYLPPPAAISLGSVATNSLLNAMTQREVQKRQDMLDQLKQQADARAQQREDERATMDQQRFQIDKQRADETARNNQDEAAIRRQKMEQDVFTKGQDMWEKDAMTHITGDIPDAEAIANDKKFHTGYIQPDDTGTMRWVGSAKERLAAKLEGRTSEIEKTITRMPEGPDKDALRAEYARLTGNKELATSLLKPPVVSKPEYEPLPLRMGRNNVAEASTLSPALAAQYTAQGIPPGMMPKNQKVEMQPAPPAASTEPKPTGNADLDWIAAHGGLTPEALANEARKHVLTGTEPPVGRTKEGKILYTAIANLMARYVKDTDSFRPASDKFDMETGKWSSGIGGMVNGASAKADFDADKASQKTLQGNLDTVTAFTNTANDNVKLIDAALKALPDTGLTYANWLARGAATATGSEAQAAFTALRQSVSAEFARIINTLSLTGVLSVDAKREMNTVLNPDAPVKAFRSALKALAAEAANREKNFRKQLDEVKGRIKGGPQSAAPAKRKYEFTVE